MQDSQKLIKHFDLKPHIEGGYFKETYKSHVHFDVDHSVTRSLNTGIYYLLEGTDFSLWHRLKSDEMWHHYCGSSLLIYQITSDGELIRTVLGNPLEDENAVPQYMVRAGIWFAAKVSKPNSFGFVGCTVSPGFEYEDMDTDSGNLIRKYPQHAEVIKEFMR